jgi:hypothetical protein
MNRNKRFISSSLFAFAIIFSLMVSKGALSQSSSSSRSNFKSCCSQGRESSISSCNQFTVLSDTSSGCKYAFTLCCNQNKRTNECDRGKRHAYAGQRCEDLQRDSYDSLTDCCGCCELGIQTRKNGDECAPSGDLNSECNSIFMDCCRSVRTSVGEQLL